MNIFADIVKIDPDLKMVYGYATTEALDSQGERVSKEAVEAALEDYLKWANIREMHKASAVGVAKEAALDDKGLYISAKIVDRDAWDKIKEGVYKGFSIGGKKIAKEEETGLITALSLTEISLVDRPANPECKFDVWKAEGGGEEMKKKNLEKVDGNLAKYAGEEILDAQTAIYALSNISYLYLKEMQEGHPEAAAQTEQLKVVIENLKNFIASEIMEMAPGDVINLAEKTGDLKKAGARHSKDDQSKVQTIHDHAVTLGADCSGSQKGELDMDLKKMEEVTDRLAKAEERITKVEEENTLLKTENADLKKQVEELKKEPEAPKGALKVVGKEADDLLTKKEVIEEPKTPLEAIRKIHQEGGYKIFK
jgi:phage head maturation protease/regulator of replication initiation timing